MTMHDEFQNRSELVDSDPIEDEELIELTEEEKNWYTIIFGRDWDEDYPPKPRPEQNSNQD
jgi:hypothetical protein